MGGKSWGQADAVVLLTTRSNDHGELGFVSDPNRLNVALSRAARQRLRARHAHSHSLSLSISLSKRERYERLESLEECSPL